MDYSNLFVCLMGMGTVFVGLICIIILCKITGALCTHFISNDNNSTVHNEDLSIVSNTQEIPNRQEFIAAVSAVIAEELGKDISAIKILSVKKL